jgi:hypothetical protein
MSKRHALGAPADQQRASIPPIPSGYVGISGSAVTATPEDEAIIAFCTHALDPSHDWSWHDVGAEVRNAWRRHVGAPETEPRELEALEDIAAWPPKPALDSVEPAPPQPTEEDARAAYRAGVHTRTWTALNEAERNAWRGHVGAPKVGCIGSADIVTPPPLDSAWQPDVAPSPLHLAGRPDWTFVVVEWVDSTTPGPGWQTPATFDDYPPSRCRSAGWLVADTPGHVTVAAHVASFDNANGVDLQGVMCIPRGCVVSITTAKGLNA